ncbi:hypothetical protein BsWGS_16306 [Bradybaena similaris]
MAAFTRLFYEDWANLPDLVLIQIFSYLSEVERWRVGSTCKHWRQCLEIPQLWRTFKCVFEPQEDKKLIKCIKKYGHFIRRLTIFIQYNAIEVLKHLSRIENVRLSYLSIDCKGVNVFCGYYSLFFVKRLFTKIGEKKEKSTLKHLSLTSCSGEFIDNLIVKISATCPNLEYFTFLRDGCMSKIFLNRMVILALKCRKIQTLHLYYTSLSDGVLKALSEAGRKPLQRLKIVCSLHYNFDLSSAAWSCLLAANPDLKVSLIFEYGCSPHCISKIMKPEIPVHELYLTANRFDPATYLQINMAVAYYEQMIEKLVVLSRPSRELQQSLLYAAGRCKKLKALYVDCVLDKDVIDQILELCPLVRDTKDYILKWSKDVGINATESATNL